ncbi:MAG: adenylate/guanylate cyclase domain-containing response regulator [Gammaproteobacteria bacterium]|nr:adenylate/guanylate cyclase domain-containing response regulator [Gammaproteobacteria bacterium]
MQPSSKTILLADDDRTTRMVLAKMLEEEGYRVDQADRGEKCLFMALEKTYDAFLVDVNMPSLGGIDLTKRLRNLDRYKNVPVIVITSMDESEKLKEVFDAGATDFIHKPVNQVVLHARLKSHLEKVEYFEEMEKVQEYLNRYISAKTQRMVEAYALTGLLPSPELHNVCVMFTDVRGFTALSQEINLDELFEKLSRHLGMQVDMVHKYGGYIDKFGGDGLMAIFEGDDMASRACRCGLDIVESLYLMQNQDAGLTLQVTGVTLPIGIGIHLGPVLIGNIGSKEHLDYSVIGETVNLASRLCGQADAMVIDVSEEVMKAAEGDPLLNFAAPAEVTIRGVAEPVRVYKVRSTESKEQSTATV